jgi:hypothetical protein
MVPDSLRALLRPLVQPRAALADDPPDAMDGAVVVAIAGFLVAGSLLGAGLVLGSAVPGTATIDNPEKPPRNQCTEPTGWPDDMEWHTPDECNLPDTVDVDLGGAAQQRLFSAALGAPFALSLLWLSVGGAGYLLTAAESFGRTLGRAAWAFLPVGLLWPVRAAGVALVAPSFSYGESPGTVRAAAAGLALGSAEPVLLSVSLVGLAWGFYVLVGAFAAETGSLTGGTLAATPLAVFGLLGVLGSPIQVQTSADGFLPAVLLFLALFGVPLLVVPRSWIQFQKTFELIGFRNTRDVKPADWYVALHRVGGLLVVAGAAVLLGTSEYLV